MTALASALKDWSRWSCWPTGRENSENISIIPITVLLEVVSAGVIQSSLEQTGIGRLMAANKLMISQISMFHQLLLFSDVKNLENSGRHGYQGTNLNVMPHWFLKIPTFRDLSSPVIKSWSNLRSSWYSCSVIQSWSTLQKEYSCNLLWAV